MNSMLKFEIIPINEKYLNIVFDIKIDKNTIKFFSFIRNHLFDNQISGLNEIYIGLNNIGIALDISFYENTNLNYLRSIINKINLDHNTEIPSTHSHFNIPINYEGEDLKSVSEYLKMDIDKIVKIHSEGIYTVGMIGFLPGFPYLLGLDDKLKLPRKSSPNTKIKAGSVAIADIFTGIYTFDSPGGWHIIGNTDFELFSILNSSKSTLKAGDTVKFIPAI